MAGIIAAAVGLALSQLTGDPFFDGAASVVIGVILGCHRDAARLRIQGAADRRGGRPGAGRSASRHSSRQEGRDGVGHVLTVHSSPDQITAMMNGRFRRRHHRAAKSNGSSADRARAKRWPRCAGTFGRAARSTDAGSLWHSAEARMAEPSIATRSDASSATRGQHGSAELEKWLRTDESQEGRLEGTDGRRRKRRPRKRPPHRLDPPQERVRAYHADYAHMRKVVGFVRRHSAQRPENIYTSRWRYSLMNWGHDPTKEAKRRTRAGQLMASRCTTSPIRGTRRS